MKLRARRGKKVLIGLVIFLCVGTLSFFGIQFFTKTGIFRIPGVVYYAEDLNEDEMETLSSIFTDEVDLDKDVYISVEESNNKRDLNEGEFLIEVSVPVADFYDLREDTDEYEESEYTYIPIGELNFNKKLLSISGDYYLDSFDKGAVFRVLKFESEKYEDEIAPLIGDTFKKEFPSKESVLTFAQTGVTALSRGMNAKLYRVGDANYFAEGLKDYLSSFDLTHTSNESSFTDYATSGNICSDKRFISTLLAVGLDIVELTGNHNVDCGADAALETIDIYTEDKS